MITSILINALGQAIFESFGQALLIYVCLQLLFQLFPGIGSTYKYDISYLGLTIITCWFLANLVYIYMNDAAVAHYSNMLVCNKNTLPGHRNVPTLLQQAEGFIIKYAKYITGLYLIGLMLHSFKLLGGLVNINQIRRQKNLSQDSLWSTKTNLLSKNLGILKVVSLYFSEHIQVPLTIGHFKPIVIFPLALINNLDNDQVEAILLHELSHIKRNDYLLNMLQCVMDTILCFNPFAWLISKSIREEREYCCDDMVVDADYNNFTYSKALLVVAQQTKQNYALAMASSGSSKYPLLNRIKRLNNMKTNDSLPKFHLMVIVAIAAIGGLLAWGIPQYSVAKTTSAHKMAKTTVAYPVAKPEAPAPAPLAPPAPSANIPAPPAVYKRSMVKVYLDSTANTSINDSLKHIKKFKIVMEDEKGNKKEYNSVDELPASARKEFLDANKDANMKFMDSAKFVSIADYKMSPEVKKMVVEMKKQSEMIAKKANSPEFKKQVMAMKIQSEKMSKDFQNNPQWKKKVAEMAIQAQKMNEQINTPEFQKQIADLKEQAEKMNADFQNNPEWQKQADDMKKQAIELNVKFQNDPQLQKQIAELQKQSAKMSKEFEKNPQWKKQVAEMQKQAEKMSKEFNDPQMQKSMHDMQEKIKGEVDQALKKAQQDTVK